MNDAAHPDVRARGQIAPAGLDAFRREGHASPALMITGRELPHKREEVGRDRLLQNLSADPDQVSSDSNPGVLPHRAPTTIAETRATEPARANSLQWRLR